MNVTEDNGLHRPADPAVEPSRTELIAMLAHELRNPLAPIANALEMLEKRADDPQVASRAHEIIRRQVRQLIRMVDDLLDASRLSRGTLEVRREHVEVGEALATAIETARPLIEARGHRLEVCHSREPLRVDGDATRLAQVFANLLNNSAKYTPAGGVISVSCERTGSAVLVRVRDTGIGIAPHVLPHVFELFTQAEPNSRHSMGGLGIGLALARQLVELHGGRIRASSDGMGKGSEFTVELPLARSDRDAPRAEVGVAARHAAVQRVLVVEDDRDTAEVMATLMRLWGYEAGLAYDGAQAIVECDRFRPDAMIVDIGLPGIDGYEVARHLRAHGATSVFLIALTGYDADTDRARATEAGYDTFLTKPVDPERLRALLGSVTHMPAIATRSRDSISLRE